MAGSKNSLGDIPENIIQDFIIPNKVNINDINDPIFFDEYNGNSLNQKNNPLNNNMKIDDYFKKDYKTK